MPNLEAAFVCIILYRRPSIENPVPACTSIVHVPVPLGTRISTKHWVHVAKISRSPPCSASNLINIKKLVPAAFWPQQRAAADPGTALGGCCRRWIRPLQAPAHATTDGALQVQRPDLQLCGAPSTGTAVSVSTLNIVSCKRLGAPKPLEVGLFIIPCPPSGGLATRRWSRRVILRPYAC